MRHGRPLRAQLQGRGFSLTELMISMALAGIVVAGAMQMHVAFSAQAHRQQEVADMQQTLRVSMMILERAIRNAGSGIVGAKKIVGRDPQGSNCPGAFGTWYGFQYSNRNAYTDPIGPPSGAYTTLGSAANDADPDWFKTVSADMGASLDATDGSGANLIVIPDPAALANWHTGDIFQIVTSNQWNPPPPPTSSGPHCSDQPFREVSAGGVVAGNKIQHNPAQSIRCFNPTPATDICIGNGVTFPAGGFPVRHISSSHTAYRIDNVSDPMTPRLVMRTAPFGTALTGAPWTVIAENVEDMQIALLMKDGRVCGDSINPGDDPAVCDPSLAQAVRLTLVVRSSSIVPGVATGSLGGYEDEPVVPVTDHRLRRAMTTIIQMRNN